MSDTPTFVDTLPDDQFARRGAGRPQHPARDLLRQHPGEWAQIRAYPADRRQQAQSYATTWKRNHPDIETTVRMVDDYNVVFARAIKIPTDEE